MRVLHVLPAIGENLGGPTRVALSSVRALREIGVDAEIATTSYGLDGVLNQNDNSHPLVDYCGVPVRFFRPFPLSYHEFIPALSFVSWLQRTISDYDVLDLHYLYTFTTSVAAKIAHASHVPYTLRAMGQLDPWSTQQGRIWKSGYRNLIDRKLLRNAASVQCTSPQEIAHVSSYKDANPILVPLGVDTFTKIAQPREKLCELFGITPDSKVILFMSRLHPKKRPDVLVKILSRLPKDVFVLFAGTGSISYISQLKGIAESLNVQKRCIFADHVSGETKEIILQGSDILALPSYSENFGVVVAEALVRGLPTLISPHVGLSYIVSKVAPELIVDFESDQAAYMCERVLGDAMYRQKLGEALSAFGYRELSWNSAGVALFEEYKRIVEYLPHLP